MAAKKSNRSKKTTKNFLSNINFRAPQTLVVVFALVASAIIGTSFAARATTPSATCSVTPNPNTVNSDYTLNVANAGAYTIFNVQVSDSQGTQLWSLAADANGNASVVGHSYWKGTSTVNLKISQHHKWTTIGSCSFQVN